MELVTSSALISPQLLPLNAGEIASKIEAITVTSRKSFSFTLSNFTLTSFFLFSTYCERNFNLRLTKYKLYDEENIAVN